MAILHVPGQPQSLWHLYQSVGQTSLPPDQTGSTPALGSALAWTLVD